MKKSLAVLFSVLTCFALFSGCGKKPAEEEQLAVYSFSGENQMFSISNGVIVLSSGGDIFYGGRLEGDLPEVTGYSTTFYIQNGNDKKVLLSGGAADETGMAVSLAGETGKISGEIISAAEADEIKNNLYFELKTTDADGGENEYLLPLSVTEVTQN